MSGIERLNASELVERFGGRAGTRRAGSSSRSRSPRHGARRACGRSRSSPSASTASCAFAASPPLLVPLRALFTPADASEGDRVHTRAARASTPPAWTPSGATCSATYRFVDMARKVVGVGSVGTRAWVFLLVGRAGKDPLVLQAKEAQASVLEPYLGASEFDEPWRAGGPGSADLGGESTSSWAGSEAMGLDGSGARLLRAPALGLEGVRRPVRSERGRACTHIRGPAAGRWPALTHAPATGSRSPHTSGRARRSTRRSPASPPPTPTRTSATTSAWPRRLRDGEGSRPSPGCEDRPAPSGRRPLKRASGWREATAFGPGTPELSAFSGFVLLGLPSGPAGAGGGFPTESTSSRRA